MLARARRYVIAAGGIAVLAAVPIALSQERQPPIESIAPNGQDSTSEGDDSSAQQETPAPQPPPSADPQVSARVGTPATEKEAKADKTEADDELREIAWSDLTAQQGMFYAAAAAAVLTFFGVLLIWRTLVHTRRAAESARDMVIEGEKATTAANAATREAKRQADFGEESFRRLERPYLFDSRSTHMLKVRYQPPGVPFLAFKLVNFGKMPAVLRSIAVRLEIKPEWPLRVPMEANREVYEIVEPGAETGEMPRLYVEGGQPGEPVGVDFPNLMFHGSYTYEDPTGALHIDRFCMRGTKHFSFVLDGGSEHNWRKTEYPKPRSDA